MSNSNKNDEFGDNNMLRLSFETLYKQLGLKITLPPVEEQESKEYFACSFSMNNIKIKFRVAKTTPTKVGQFVTLWKRIKNGPIQPFDLEDPHDFYVVCAQEGKTFGQFVFNKKDLAAEDILSKSGKGGKRAFRVYAPWVKTESSQATKTKSWQTKYFIDLSDPKKVDLKLAKKLFKIE